MQGVCIVKSMGAIKVPFKSVELNGLPAIGLVHVLLQFSQWRTKT